MNWFEALAPNNALIINKSLIRILGLNGAVLVSELINQYNLCQAKKELIDGSFYTTAKKLENNTGLDENQLKDELFKLKTIGIIDYCNLGLSRKKYFRFNKKTLWKVLQE